MHEREREISNLFGKQTLQIQYKTKNQNFFSFYLCPCSLLDLCRLVFDGLMAPGTGLGQSGQGFIGETSPVVSLCTFRVCLGAFITMKHHWSSQISMVGCKEG